MTKKDFELIARTIKTMADQNAAELAAYAFADALGETNASFDRNRFLRACGMATVEHIPGKPNAFKVR